MRYKKKNFKIQVRGVTLIELLVAMSIFIVVISIVANLFVMGLRGQRKVIALQNAQDNARFLLEFIGKEVRMGRVNSVTATTLDITRPDGTDVTYTFDAAEQQIERDDTSGVDPPIPINSDQALVTGSFSGLGIGTGDGQQARVTIAMTVEITGAKPEERAKISIQTSLCQRDLEYLNP